MTPEERIEFLRSYEWRDVEFKEARSAVPRSAYETVSAFANTEGGHLVFGVRESGNEVEIVGVLEVDKVPGDLLSTLRQRDKISTLVPVREHLRRHEDADLLIFRVPEAHRSAKPVFLDGDIRRAFVRSGGNDVRLSNVERDRFLMDAAAERYDSQPIDLDPGRAFDEESLGWYRSIYESRPGNRSYRTLSDYDFLGEMGLLRDEGGVSRPSRAAVLLFGSDRAFRQLLPRAVVDCQRFGLPREEASTGERWFDRLVLEDNLLRTWRSLMDTWYPRFTEHPFRVDPGTLRRDDAPLDLLAIREALVNLLMHQDYADHGRCAEILHYPDQTVFRNPGDAFAPTADLLEPGEKGHPEPADRARVPPDRPFRERRLGAPGCLPHLAAVRKGFRLASRTANGGSASSWRWAWKPSRRGSRHSSGVSGCDSKTPRPGSWISPGARGPCPSPNFGSSPG